MFLKNNSKKEWLGFQTGIQEVDIKAESVFEVSDADGDVLLKLLGCEAWLVKVDGSNIKVEKTISKKLKSKKLTTKAWKSKK